MGNHRFKLSDMIPNAWFYKLKDMSRSRKQKGSHAVKNQASSPVMSQRSPPNCLHYFPTEPYKAGILFNSPIQTKVTDFSFTVSPRRSSKRRVQRKTIYKPSPSVVSSVSTSCRCHWTHQPNQAESPDFYASSVESSSSELDLYECVTSESDECDSLAAPHMLNGLSPDCSCRVSSSTNDIIIDMNNESFAVNPEKLDGFDAISKLGLPPIVTKPVRFDDQVIEAHYLKCSSKVEESSRTTTPKFSGNSRGIRLRVNSAKIARRKVQACARRSVSSSSSSSACKVSRNTTGFAEGFAVFKSSIDPQRDFKESMVEMIRENNIWSSEDLEDLLACYLSLNSREYHELIIKAFEQTWFDSAQLNVNFYPVHV